MTGVRTHFYAWGLADVYFCFETHVIIDYLLWNTILLLKYGRFKKHRISGVRNLEEKLQTKYK